jgi:diaminohydroxyphosphoribosylaminopyrimidine deaminase/5-amino-6-(5-phosphoribosylamino)uracil reductase
MVGAVVVRNEKVIATGFHAQDGAHHAEVDALKQLALGEALGATLYVNLEPCCHYGRTPPCTDAIIAAGISRVVVANTDPDPRVAGKGIALLRSRGIDVDVGVLRDEGERLNSIYFYNRRTGLPYIVLKAALTLDGKVATRTGDAKWISGAESRDYSQDLRRRLKAILIGKNTLVEDHPRLNCRFPGCEHKPLDKIVLTSSPQLVQEHPAFQALSGSPGRVFALEARTREAFLEFCVSQKMDSVLVEGGGKVLQWFLKNSLADRVILFYRPCFMGNDGRPVVSGEGPEKLSELFDFSVVGTHILGNNVMIDLAKGEPLCLRD